MGVNLLPVGPGVPAELQELLQSFHDAISQLQQPGAPAVVPKIALAANLPAAADYPDCVIQVVDKSCVALSTETAPGTWTWLRADGSAL